MFTKNPSSLSNSPIIPLIVAWIRVNIFLCASDSSLISGL
nr:MAG TPA: hypothetical protein [Bacteriophage sp.]